MRLLVAALLVILPGCASQLPQKSDNVAVVWNRVDEPHRVPWTPRAARTFSRVLRSARGPAHSRGSMAFAEIALPIPLRQTFTYHVPEPLAGATVSQDAFSVAV